MSELRSVLDQMAGMANEDLTVAELHAEIEEILDGQRMLDVLLATRVQGLAEHGGYRELGYTSPTSYLAHVGRMSPGRAKRVVSRANAAERAPIAYAAWADGRISTDQANHMFRAAEGVPDAYPEAEERLVEILERLDAVDTSKAVEYWRQSVDGPGEIDIETQSQRRGLSISATMGGMRRVDGWLTALAGEALETAIDALMPPPRDEDARTPRQRRHDALEDLCRDWLDNGTTPTVGGEKPHLSLLTDLDALQGLAGGLHETLEGDIIDVNTLRLIACDCSISRIVLGPDSEVLDVGRKTRVWTPAQRRAIVARDRHCQAPGCRARPKHCDIHHLDHWADGGETSIEKGMLLCRPHHVEEHVREMLRRRRRTRT
jgi:hypothetical protein